MREARAAEALLVRQPGRAAVGLVLALGFVAAALPSSASATVAASTDLELVSVAHTGAQGNGHSLGAPASSADGRYIAFSSYASNLVEGDDNLAADVFVRDRLTGSVERVSVDTAGRQGDRGSTQPSISADGRVVAFVSTATTLVPGDTNRQADVFVHDRVARTTERASLDSEEGQADYLPSSRPSLSADGRFVAFESNASDLVPGDRNRLIDAGTAGDVFVRDLLAGTTARVSLTSTGGEGHGSSSQPSISGNGRLIAFQTTAPLVPQDAAGSLDVYVHDRSARTTRLVSVGREGGPASGPSSQPTMSSDGRTIAFVSAADDLPTDSAVPVFVHDLRAASTTGLPRGSSTPLEGVPGPPAISGDGQLVTFGWRAPDGTDTPHVFLVDRSTGTTTTPFTHTPDGSSGDARLSADGRLLAFSSRATDLVTGDTNRCSDAFAGIVERIPVIRLDISSAAPGDAVTLSAAGFAAGERLRISAGDLPLMWRTVDPTGRLAAQVTVPMTATPGTQVVYTVRAPSGRSATANLLVTGVAPAGHALFESEKHWDTALATSGTTA